MVHPVLKYISTGFLLMIYINRGLFVSPVEVNVNSNELNSVAEFLIEIITGQSNNIDEDGNSQETYNSAKIVQPFIAQQFTQSLELWNEFMQKPQKKFFPVNENLPKKLVLGQIAPPPEN